MPTKTGKLTLEDRRIINRRNHALNKNKHVNAINEATREAKKTLDEIKDYFEGGLGKLAERYEEIMDLQVGIATGEVKEINGVRLTPAQVLKARGDLLKLLPQVRPPSESEAPPEKNEGVKGALEQALAEGKVNLTVNQRIDGTSPIDHP